MVNITKVYTRLGDEGMTHLGAGKRVSKLHARIQAIGSIDELNAYIGWVVVNAMEESLLLQEFVEKCQRIQNELFNLGAQLAVLKEDRRHNTPLVKMQDTTRLEEELDMMNEDLPALTSFILPGGGELGARLHIARTICRRAERDLLALDTQEKLDGVELPYINRLSDWLFVAARWVAKMLDEKEMLWMP